MANEIKILNTAVANSVLLNIQKANLFLQHANMDYNDQFRDEAIGLRGNAVEITTTLSSEPARIFTGTIVIDDYKEGSITLLLDTVADKSFKFNLREENFNPGALERATKIGSKDVVDRMEISFLKELYLNARVIYTPSGTLQDNKDMALIEKAAIDLEIPDGERVLFINSSTKAALASNTNIFAYARDGADLYSDGMGTGNSDFENGTGYAVKIFGVSIFVSSKTTPEYLNKYVVDSIKTGTTYLDTATAKVVDGELFLTVVANDAFVLKRGNVLKIGTVKVKVVKDVVVTAGAARDVAVEVVEDVTTIVNGTEAELEDIAQYGSVLFSNKAVAFAIKALSVESDARQALASDPDTGMAIRITRDYDIYTKSTVVSIDAIYGVKALTDKIAIF